MDYRIEQSDLRRIVDLCIYNNQLINKKSSYKISENSRLGFFFKLLGDYSGYEIKLLYFWWNSKFFDPNYVNWNVKISNQAFLKVAPYESNDDLMIYFIELIKGRFKVVNTYDHYILIEPYQKINIDLFPFIIKTTILSQELILLVGVKDDHGNEFSVNEAIKETKYNPEKFENLKYDKNLDIYYPKNFQLEDLNLEKNEMVQQYLIPSKPFRPFFKSEQNLSKDLKKLKISIHNYIYKKFNNINETKEVSWIRYIILYLEKQLNKEDQDEIFNVFKIAWNIDIENNLLNILKKLTDIEVLHYFGKILMFAKGQVIENEEFYSLNNYEYESFLIAPLTLEGTNLKPILTVLCIGTSYLNEQYEYQLKLIGFYNKYTLENQIQEFRESNMYKKIQSTFHQQGIKSLILINKEDKSCVPKCTIEDILDNSLKKIIFLHELTTPTTKFSFSLISEGIKSDSSIQILKFLTQNKFMCMVMFKTNLPTNSSYTLKLEIKRENNILYYDDLERKIGNTKENFLFDIIFKRDQRILKGSFKSDRYNQLFILIKHYMNLLKFEQLENLIYSFCKVSHSVEESNEFSINKQIKIVTWIDDYLKNIKNYNSDIIYLVLSVLGTIEKFPSDKLNVEFKNFGEFYKNIENIFNNSFEIIKTKINYNAAIKGLAKIYFYAYINKFETQNPFLTINDQMTFSNFTIDYFEILKANRILLTSIELETLFYKINSFESEGKFLLSRTIFGLLFDVKQKVKLIMDPLFINREDEEIRILKSDFENTVLSFEELSSFLKYLKDTDFYNKNIIPANEIIKILNKHLFNKRIPIEDYPIIKEILELIINETRLSNFNIKTFFLEQVKIDNLKFFSSLLKLIPDKIPEILKNVLRQSLPINEPEIFYNQISTQFDEFSRNFQKESFLYLFENFNSSDLKQHVHHIHKINNDVLKESFTEVFIKKLLIISKKTIYKETVKFILSERKGGGENYILNKLLVSAQKSFKISKNKLINKFSKKHNENDFILNFIKSYDQTNKIKAFDEILKTIKSYFEKIIKETIKVEKYEKIFKNDDCIFLKYVECAYFGLKPRNQLFENLKNVQNKFKELNKNLKQIDDFISKFDKNFEQNLKGAKRDNEEFRSNMSQLSIGKFILPESLIWIIRISNKFPINSILFANYLIKNSLNCQNGMESYFLQVKEYLAEFFRDLIKNKNKKLSVVIIKDIFSCITHPDEVKSEVQELSKFFEEISKQCSIFEDKFLEIIKFLEAYNGIYPIIDVLNNKEIVEILQLDDCLKDYHQISLTSYTQALSSLVSKLEKNDLGDYDKKEKNSLIEFLNQVIESKDLVKLVHSLKDEEELSYWQENFDERLSHGLSLELIYDFVSIWLFFVEIKNYNKLLKHYFYSIIQTLKIKKYSRIVELIKSLSLECKHFKKYNESLNSQEQLNLNKINLIYKDSKVKFKSQEYFSAKIIIIHQSKNYNLRSIFLNELIELKYIALLKESFNNQQIEDDNKNKKIVSVYAQYIEIIDTVCSYIDTYNKLKDSLFQENLEKKIIFPIKNGNLNELKEEHTKLKKQLNSDWEKATRIFCKKNYMLNFLNGKSLILVDKFLYEQNNENLKGILRVLNFMQKKSPINVSNIKKKPPSNISDRLNEIIEFLTKLKDIPQNLESPIDIEIRKKVKGSIILVETKDFFKGILSIYLNYQKILPRADLVFFCHFSSNITEIKKFLNRCKLNLKEEIYTLVYPEKLSSYSQNIIKKELGKSIIQRKNFYLAIVTNNLESLLIKSLKIERIYISNMLSDEQMKDIFNKIAPNIVVVKSAYVGLGKSEFIKEVAITKEVPLIEIDISASYNNLSLLKKLENVLCTMSAALYKVNLDNLTDTEYFKEIIFAFSVFKLFYSEQSTIVIQNHSYIYIEIANTYKDNLYDSVSFLKFFKTENINEFCLDRVKKTEKLIYVCNYLFLFDSCKMNYIDLKFEKNSKDFIFSDAGFWLELLKKYFLPYCKKPANYHKITVFLNYLSKIFITFEEKFYNYETIKYLNTDEYGEIFLELQSGIINSLLETCDEFLSRSTDSLELNEYPRTNSQIMLERNEKMNSHDILINSENNVIKWENSNHLIVIFSDQKFNFIYRSIDIIPNFIKKFIIWMNLQKKINKDEINNTKKLWSDIPVSGGNIKEYKNYESSKLKKKLSNIYNSFSSKNLAEPENMENLKGYILTPDNFLKMHLIYLRSISQIPLIIIGETGCGKTSLLEFFIKGILRESFLKLYIHSGISVLDIENHLNLANIEADRLSDKRVWVFFDEFNTSDTMNLIVSLLCERRFEGIKLHHNLVFLGACNPLRRNNKKSSRNIGINKSYKDQNNTIDVYMVKPLPFKVFEFVWDFGLLGHNELEVYVNSMLIKAGLKEIRDFTGLIIEAHKYFQENEDGSSVSLRDINRFIKLSEWFSESIKKSASFTIKNPVEEYYELSKSAQTIGVDESIIPQILSFVHCYYFRIETNKQRISFLRTVNNTKIISNEQILRLVKLYELELISRMVLPKEIAINEALIENIFVALPCILQKIPIFICGKPGCSKSLAISIIFSSIRGDRSADKYLSTLPELQLVYFQGSESCTSEAIEATFKKAEKLINPKKNILPVILFDEIGLAENSKNNPLKILHKLLECDECKVGFIAISNWRLDASKMNRVLYLARPDPDEKDLIKTAEKIFSSQTKIRKIEKYSNIFKDIVSGYLNIKKECEFNDFFGLRDFYHAVKYIARNINLDDESESESVIQLALYRNFNGLPNTIDRLCKYYPMIFKSIALKISPDNLIEKALQCQASRYLMIICSQTTSEYLKSNVISKYQKEFRYILGSEFENDKDEESKKFRTLSDIIGYIEGGFLLILENMDHIYSSLYDLFNKNFKNEGKCKKYCRIALGAQFNPRCLVHENFKAVVFLDSEKSKILSADPPLLNRFEKHYIELKAIFQESTLKMSKEICEWIQNIVEITNEKNILPINSIFPLYSEDTIILYIKFFEEKNDFEQLIEKCKNFLLINASMDIVLINQKEESIIKRWKENHGESFKKYINKISDLKNKKQLKIIIVTNDNTEIDTIKGKNEKNIQFEKCCNFRSEDEFKKNYKIFLNNDKVLYIIELDYFKEFKHLRPIISFMEVLEMDFKVGKKKLVKNTCIMVRQKRSIQIKKPLHFTEKWIYRFFESLEYTDSDILQDLIEKDIKIILEEEKFFKFENFALEIVDKSLVTLSLKSEFFNFEELNGFKKELFNYITSEKNVLNAFKQKIITKIGRLTKEKWLKIIFISEKEINSSGSIKDAIKNLIYNKFLKEFTRLFVICEKKSGLSSLLFTKTSREILSNWLKIFNSLNIENIKVQVKPASNQLNIKNKFNFPYFYEEYKNLELKYRKLMDTRQTEDNMITGLNKFYKEKSLFGEEGLKLVYDNKEFKKYFIEDFIKVTITNSKYNEYKDFIKSELTDSRYNKYIYLLVTDLLKGNSNSKIKLLFDSQAKIILLVKLLSLYNKYKRGSEIKIKNLESFLSKIIKKITQLKIRSTNDINEYSCDIILLYDSLSELDVDEKKYDLSKLEFLVKLFKLQNYELTLNIITLLEKNEFFEEKTAKEIIKSFSIDNEQTYFFKIFYFKQTIKRNHKLVPFIINQINNSDLWKYSGLIIKKLLKFSELPQLLEKIESGKMDFFKGLKNSKNSYFKQICDGVKKLNLNKPFFFIFRDKIKALKFDVEPSSYGNICKIYMKYIEKSNGREDKIPLIISIGRIQAYLNEFSKLHNQVELGNNENDKVESIRKVLENREIQVFELYCLKVLNELNKNNMQDLIECCRKAPFKWKINYSEIISEDYDKLLLIPYDSTKSAFYKEIEKKIEQLIFNSKELENIIKKQQKTNDIIIFGIAFINNVYLKHRNRDFSNGNLIKWYNKNEKNLKKNFNEQFALLIKQFITNFPQNSILYLNENIEADNLNRAMIISYAILITVSYSKKPNMFSSQFFNLNGKLYENIYNESARKYFIGAETRPIQDYLFFMMQNLGNMTSGESDSYCVCSDVCDYLYIIGDCGAFLRIKA